MTHRRNILFFIVGATLSAGVIGVALLVFNSIGSNKGDQEQELAVMSSEGTQETTTQPHSPNEVQSTDSVPSLQDLEQFQGEFEWNHALYTLLAQADQDLLSELVEQSREVAPLNRKNRAQQAIFQRLASINPWIALEQSKTFPDHRQHLIVGSVFEEWSKADLGQSVEAAVSLEGERKLGAIHGILRSRNEISEELRSELVQQLDLEYIPTDSYALESMLDLYEDPESAWIALLNDQHSDDPQTGLLMQIAHSWVDTNGFSALREINDSLRGDYDFQGNLHNFISILNSVIYRVARQDIQDALSQALTLDNDPGQYIAKEIAKLWAESDPRAAYATLMKFEEESDRLVLESTVLGVWARMDPTSLLNELNAVSDRMRSFAKQLAISSISEESPQIAAEMIVNMEDSATKLDIAWSIASSWSGQDPTGALEWVLNTPHLQDIKNDLLRVVIPELVQVDPQLAFSAALKQPIAEKEIGLEVTVVAHLAKEDWNGAILLLPQVREGRTKNAAYSAVGQTLVREGEIHEAFNLAESLSDKLRKSFHEFIIKSWSAHDPSDLVDSLDELPSKEAQSYAASLLLNPHPLPNLLTEEEITRVKSFLLE